MTNVAKIGPYSLRCGQQDFLLLKPSGHTELMRGLKGTGDISHSRCFLCGTTGSSQNFSIYFAYYFGIFLTSFQRTDLNSPPGRLPHLSEMLLISDKQMSKRENDKLNFNIT